MAQLVQHDVLQTQLVEAMGAHHHPSTARRQGQGFGDFLGPGPALRPRSVVEGDDPVAILFRRFMGFGLGRAEGDRVDLEADVAVQDEVPDDDRVQDLLVLIDVEILVDPQADDFGLDLGREVLGVETV